MTAYGFDISRLFHEDLPVTRHAAGEKIFTVGDTGDQMFVVRSGKVKVIAAGMVLETIGEGGIFGELAVIDGSDRSANAVVAEPCELLAIDKQAFLAVIATHPAFAVEIMRILAGRLRRTTESI